MKIGNLLVVGTLALAVKLALSPRAGATGAGDYLAERFKQRELATPLQPNVNQRLRELEQNWREGRETKPRKYRLRRRNFSGRRDGEYDYDPGGSIDANPNNAPAGAPSVSAPAPASGGGGITIGPGDWGGPGLVSCPTC